MSSGSSNAKIARSSGATNAVVRRSSGATNAVVRRSSGATNAKIARSSGVQLHITSLPEGRLGAGAYAYVDWLERAGQSWWQVLPLGPPDRHRSPYKASSAFAAWPGLLADRRAPVGAAEILDFRDRHAEWIGDWEGYAGREAVADQVRFEREWERLRAYAAERGVRLIGDIAIYVAPGSADHLAHPELFQHGLVAGAPPDAYSASGQLWGNPLYDWPALRRRSYRWWTARLRRTLELFDLARIDHFRGFVAYWAVPAGARTARSGHWKRGPGRALFDAMAHQLEIAAPLPLIAEDLGVITPAVDRLRDTLGLPGMLVLQFAFDPEDPNGPHRPENHHEDRVVYTGTHDHDTLPGWYEALPAERRSAVDEELVRRGLAGRAARGRGARDPAGRGVGGKPWWGLIRLALSSPARLAMLQLQDVLGLGSEARMNAPGRAQGNWRWRVAPGALRPALADRLREVTEEAGRLP